MGFISTFEQLRGATGDELLWGDEIEYHMVAVDDQTRSARVSLRAPEVHHSPQIQSLRTAAALAEAPHLGTGGR